MTTQLYTTRLSICLFFMLTFSYHQFGGFLTFTFEIFATYCMMLSFLFDYYFWLFGYHLAYANLVPVSNNLRAWGGLSRIFSLPELESVLNMCSSWIIWKMHKIRGGGMVWKLNHEQFHICQYNGGKFLAENKSMSISIRAKPTNQNEHRQI